jgi:ribonuclease BN (tRNA processing enzyme)
LEKLHNVSAFQLQRLIKELKPGQTFPLPDGSSIRGEDAVEPPIRGRKIVIMGDTTNGDSIAPIARGADVLVHEATLAYVPDVMEAIDRKYTDYDSLEADARSRGHSTPQMAGTFAQQIGAKQLILTHFSPRFSGDPTPDKMEIMWKIEDQARTGALASNGVAVTGPVTNGIAQSTDASMRAATPKLNPLQSPNDVIAAWDAMQLNIPFVRN